MKRLVLLLKLYLLIQKKLKTKLSRHARVPQGRVLYPVLYTIFTSDLPSTRSRHVLTSTNADDTAFLATSDLQIGAIDLVPDMFNKFEDWRRGGISVLVLQNLSMPTIVRLPKCCRNQ